MRSKQIYTHMQLLAFSGAAGRSDAVREAEDAAPGKSPIARAALELEKVTSGTDALQAFAAR